jgi:ubiquinone/menaquinone biosynthesis C-methylase UbiE
MKGVLQSAKVYDRIIGSFDRLGLGRLRRQTVGGLAGDILEIGVGTGLTFEHYGPDARVTGIEPAGELLEAARERARGRGYRVEQADAQALPFPDASFDIVVSTLVFCSIPDAALVGVLNEARRVLRPGGTLIQVEHTRTNRRWFDAILDAIAPVWLKLSGGCHVNRDTPALLERAGWRIARHERRALGLYRLLVSTPPARDAVPGLQPAATPSRTPVMTAPAGYPRPAQAIPEQAPGD